MRARRWDDVAPAQKVLVMLLVSLQVSLAVSAWVDLALRPADQIKGRKRTWAAVIAVNVIGPVLYFRCGPRPATPRLR